jgi:hypothetical protein
LDLKLDNIQIKIDKYPKFLGITFDPSLNFKKHFEFLISKCHSSLNLLKVLRNKIKNKNKLINIYKALTLSNINYSFINYTIASQQIKNEIQKIQNSALKIIYKKSFYFSTNKLHIMANINSIQAVNDKLLNNYLKKIMINKNRLELFSEYFEETRICSINNIDLASPFHYLYYN